MPEEISEEELQSIIRKESAAVELYDALINFDFDFDAIATRMGYGYALKQLRAAQNKAKEAITLARNGQ